MSGTCLFSVIRTNLASFYACPSFSSPLITFLWTDLQMAPTVELPINGLSYRGFAQMLYDVFEELGVPTELIEYVYHGELGPDRL